jgi:hypothetical protein
MPKFPVPTSRVLRLLARNRVSEAIAASELSLGMRPVPRWKQLLEQGHVSESIAATERELGMRPSLRRTR